LKILILDFDLDFEERSDDPQKKSPLKSEELERILVRIIVEDFNSHTEVSEVFHFLLEPRLTADLLNVNLPETTEQQVQSLSCSNASEAS